MPKALNASQRTIQSNSLINAAFEPYKNPTKSSASASGTISHAAQLNLLHLITKNKIRSLIWFNPFP